ncbi:NAD(P)H dehydrogenase (quinone) [Chitinophaga rupis]|uniref:NAD(P)H dehydrogenase (Quinone) n=1 Tax=Chitinophaga rupis TaxID=573321 RepID=A0A1H7ZMD1_9BACT|nr:SDR family oxidoreductase [Chitinophaga rupis]SEM58659.1 NAD(P)H dehydrogenase (quinone) [Chitinophaga rupis]
MILVTGANGHFGKATVEFLLQKGIPAASIGALVREEAKGAALKARGVTILTGDYNNYASLVSAFAGAEKVLLVSGTELEQRSAQQENVVNAAKAAGVQHLVYTSVERRTDSENSPLSIILSSHFHTEKVIKASGIPYTMLRNNIYLDMLPMFLGQTVLEKGVFFPAGDGAAGFALRSDMAEAAANILAGTGHENKDYHISGPALSFGRIAEILSDISGKKVPYNSPDGETYIKTVVEAGVPALYAGFFAGFGEAIRQGELYPDHTDLPALLGRTPTGAEQYFRQVYGA